MSAASDAAARRQEWLKQGAPDYNNPTTNSSGQVTGYVSVASEPESARSQSNQSLDIINGNVVDTVTGQTYPTVQPRPATQPTTQPSSGISASSDGIALDGQTFRGQTAAVQAEFTSAYGSNAAAVWTQQHDAWVLSNGSNQGQSTPANVTTNVSTTSPGSGTSTTGSSTATTATTAATTATVGLRQALDPLWTWAQANPVIAGVLTIGLAGMLFGGKHRW